MLKKICAAAILLALAAPAAAQQQDGAFMTRAISVLTAQRNQAMDAAASYQVRSDMLQEELVKAQERIKQLEAKAEEKPEEKK